MSTAELGPLGMALVFVTLLGLVVGSLIWSNVRSDELIQRWSGENGYRVISSEQRYLSRGPFFWTTARGQTVFYVTLQSPDGSVQRVWVRCGSWWGGVMFSNQVEVRWDE